MEEYLKRCPFCGGEATLTANYSYKTRAFFVMGKCSFCGSQGKIYNSNEDPEEAGWNNNACTDAVRAWNMRREEE